jgi:hypothetical protein
MADWIVLDCFGAGRVLKQSKTIQNNPEDASILRTFPEDARIFRAVFGFLPASLRG